MYIYDNNESVLNQKFYINLLLFYIKPFIILPSYKTGRKIQFYVIVKPKHIIRPL